MRFMKNCLNRLSSKGGKRFCIHLDHLKYKQRVTPLTCLRCTVFDREVASPRQTGGLPTLPPKIDLSEAPPQTPQEPCERHLEITPLWTLKYTRSGWEPPPCPRGYHPRSDNPESDDAWIFDLIRMPCRHLEVLPAETGQCGYQRIIRRCRSIDSFIGDKTCEVCRSREDV